MAKTTVEIEDDLEERKADVQTEVKEHFIEYLKEHPNLADFEEYYQDTGCDAIHEIADSSTPIFYSDIDGLYYLYGDELEDAYKSEGIGNGSEANHKQVAIYCYLSQAGFEMQRAIQHDFELWKKESSLKEPEMLRSLDEFLKDLADLEV